MIPHSKPHFMQKFFLQLKTFFVVKFNGLLLFFRELFSNPLVMGAAWPSSNRLARAMAKQVPLESSGMIVELGPGTGVVTRALLEHGVKIEKLVAIEQSGAFVKHLTRRFAKLKVIEGDAKNLRRLLTDYSNIHVIVSSLPLRSLPEDTVKSILEAIDNVLPDGGLFIQFTYYYGKAVLSLPKTFQRVYSEYVLLNFPPARVDVFCRNQAKISQTS